MSEQTREALDAALAAHFADEMDGALLTGYIGQCEGSSMEPGQQGTTVTYRISPTGQSIATTLGLIDYLRIAMHLNVEASFNG